jgi:ubiquinone/menaquinone biosynthesis C-methylase UbiE
LISYLLRRYDLSRSKRTLCDDQSEIEISNTRAETIRMSLLPSASQDRNKLWNKDKSGSSLWLDRDRGYVTARYDRLAGLIPLFDWLFFQPPGFRRKAATRLGLAPGQRVLEIGCGTGRNLPFLQAAVGPTGCVYGVDLSAGMLAKARALCERQNWANVELIESDAIDYVAPSLLDGVMFGLSYNTMPHHLAVLHHYWNQLRPGGRLVIMDAKLPNGLLGRMTLPFGLWLMKRTMLGNPLIRPWEDLARLSENFEMEEFVLGSWYICRAVKT